MKQVYFRPVIVLATEETIIPTDTPLREVRIRETNGIRRLLTTATITLEGTITGGCGNSWKPEEATIESYMKIVKQCSIFSIK